jgi:DNA-binding NtrC family response regulator
VDLGFPNQRISDSLDFMHIKATTMASDTLPEFERHPAQPGEPYPSALALAGMSILIVEDEPLIATSVESGLQDAGAAVVKIAASISAAHSVIDAENSFDAAVVDLHIADGDASSLIGVLSERGIPAVVTTGGIIDRELLTQTVAVLQMPYSETDLIKILASMVK